jgi:ribose-phosphate pyrophosphokinase
MERAVQPGEIVTAKTRAVLLSSIPQARFSNEIVMIDLHTGGIPHYFEDHIRPYHLSAKNVIAAILGELESPNKVLASTDAGRAKWVENLANEIGIDAAFVYKRRFDGENTAIRGINANVEGRHVVIYDDMIRTGGSLIKAAQAYEEAGAARLTAITTHGVLPGNALERIRESGLFDHVFLTDTHPRALELEAGEANGFLQIRSIVPELARFLQNREDYGANGYLHT